MAQKNRSDQIAIRRLGSEVPHLLSFWIAAECGSINKAAAELNISQPALTRCLRRLEKTVGATLLERSSLGVKATAQGELLLTHAKTIAANLTQIIKDIEAAEKMGRGEIRLGATPFSASQFVWKAVDAFQRQNARIKVKVLQRERRDILARLRRGELDIAVAMLSDDYPEPDLVERKLHTDDVGLYVRRTHKLASRKALCLHDLLSESWVIPEEDVRLRDLLDRELRKVGAKLLGPVIETSSLLMINTFLLNTDRIALLRSPSLIFDDQHEVIRLKGDWQFPRRSHGYFLREGGSRGPMVSALLAQLEAAVPSGASSLATAAD